MGKMVVRLNKNAVVALLYFVEGSGMRNEYSELRRIYVGDSRGDIERQIIEDYKITGGLKDYLNYNWGTLAYYDNQSEAEQEKERNTPPDQPTIVRTLVPMVAAMDYDTPYLGAGNVRFMHAPKQLGIKGDLKEGVEVAIGTLFVVPYEYATYLTDPDHNAFEIVE